MAGSQSRAPKPQASGGLTLRISETASEFYANHVQIITSEWDMTLLFGTFQLPDEIAVSSQQIVGQAPGLVSDVVIRMSPQSTKSLLMALTRVVARYEETHGVLKVLGEGED